MVKLLDPRVYQIFSLLSLATFGYLYLDLEFGLPRFFIIVSSTIIFQFLFLRLYRVPGFDIRSPLISGLSLSILLQTNSIEWAIAAAFVTVAGKFLIRVNNKHIFNPTNFAIAVMLSITDQVWISPGQWGNTAFFGFLFVCIGGMVVNKASRSDITYAFIFFYALILFSRSYYLGEPMTIPFHSLQNGGLLIFTFFMISDPMTTPNSRTGRILFAMIVALGAGYVHFVQFATNGLIWSLFALAPLSAVIDKIWTADKYSWGVKPNIKRITKQSIIIKGGQNVDQIKTAGCRVLAPIIVK